MVIKLCPAEHVHDWSGVTYDLMMRTEATG